MNRSLRSAVHKPLHATRDLADKRTIKQFARKFGFVYFGEFNHHEDEYQLVRGLTAGARHRDSHYSVGAFRGHDLTLVERSHLLGFPNKTPQEYRWLVMQFDLRHGGQPHIFIEGHHHEEVFFANLFAAQPHFYDATDLLLQHDPFFLKNFKVFASAQTFEEVQRVLTTNVTAMLGHHFRQFDFEIRDDLLFVYATKPAMITLSLLQEMLRVGAWLADQLDGGRIGS